MKKAQLFLAFLIIVTSIANAESYVLDVQGAVDLAIEKNLNLEIEELKLLSKEYEKNHVWNQFIPQLRFTPAITGTLNEVFTDFEVDADVNYDGNIDAADGIIRDNLIARDGWSAAVGGSIQLALNAGAFVAIDATVQDYRNSMISYETAVAQLTRDVKKSYYNLILVAKSIELVQENYETAVKRAEQAQIRYNSGYISRLALLQTQATVENIEPQLLAQRHIFQLSVLNFKLYLGLEFADEIELSEDQLLIQEVTLDLETLIDEQLTSRFDIQLLMGNLDYLQKSRAAYLTGQLSPSVIFGLNYNAIYTLAQTNNSAFKYSSDQVPMENGSFSIAFSVPIDQYIPGSSSQVQGKLMQDQTDQLKVQLQNALRFAELEIRSTSMNLDNSWETIQSLDFNIELNQEVYDESEAGYNAGRIDILDLEETEDRLEQAKIDLISEKVTYLSNLADLEYAVNCTINENGEFIPNN